MNPETRCRQLKSPVGRRGEISSPSLMGGITGALVGTWLCRSFVSWCSNRVSRPMLGLGGLMGVPVMGDLGDRPKPGDLGTGPRLTVRWTGMEITVCR